MLTTKHHFTQSDAWFCICHWSDDNQPELFLMHFDVFLELSYYSHCKVYPFSHFVHFFFYLNCESILYYHQFQVIGKPP